jgi:histidine triad (HIT) family protein
VLAFMDVMPQADGHTLVIPKAPTRNLLDADPATFGPLFAAVQKLAVAARKAFSAEGILVKQFNEPAAGQTVFPIHFHILPCYEGQELRMHARKMADKEVLAEHAERVKQALARH